MRLKLGRPDLSRYAARFDVPAPGPAGTSLAVTFLGVSTLLFDDGGSAVMTDGFFSRPSLLRAALGSIGPDHARIDAALKRAVSPAEPRLDVVVPVHTHFDHAMDSAVVAERTGAMLLGGESCANVGRGHGLPADRITVATPGKALTFGSFTLTLVESDHCPPDRSPGMITEPVVPPVRMAAYRCGEAWSIVLTHWDDFFRPLDLPLRALPFAGDDLDVTMRVLGRLADTDGVALHLPTVWRRENPWAGL